MAGLLATARGHHNKPVKCRQGNKHVHVAADSKQRVGSYAEVKKQQRKLLKTAKRKRDADSTTGQTSSKCKQRRFTLYTCRAPLHQSIALPLQFCVDMSAQKVLL